MAGLRARSMTIAGWAGVVLVGALVPLAVVLLAGGGERIGWVVVAGAAACASGLVFGTTQRVLPALVLAAVAAAALAIAATTTDEEPARDLADRTTAGEFVRGYYAAIEAGDYEEAWSRRA